ncbi:hypothetical protein B0H14DRAFT_2614672 [Mycena olivaceomarginata]|nr:hypothetical protein B0H14DRAFT_2614672 [Mycena olivaceomarginata]
MSLTAAVAFPCYSVVQSFCCVSVKLTARALTFQNRRQFSPRPLGVLVPSEKFEFIYFSRVNGKTNTYLLRNAARIHGARAEKDTAILNRATHIQSSHLQAGVRGLGDSGVLCAAVARPKRYDENFGDGSPYREIHERVERDAMQKSFRVSEDVWGKLERETDGEVQPGFQRGVGWEYREQSNQIVIWDTKQGRTWGQKIDSLQWRRRQRRCELCPGGQLVESVAHVRNGGSGMSRKEEDVEAGSTVPRRRRHFDDGAKVEVGQRDGVGNLGTPIGETGRAQGHCDEAEDAVRWEAEARFGVAECAGADKNCQLGQNWQSACKEGDTDERAPRPGHSQMAAGRRGMGMN